MEPDLVQRAQRGDHEAFTQLASAVTDGLYAVAYRMLRDTALAEDATQQALLDAWRKLPQLRDTDRVEAWMHRLLINACKDELGRARSRAARLQLLRAPRAIVPRRRAGG
jgi:RNA polymerase sigma-70 factor (ECF subfamily)